MSRTVYIINMANIGYMLGECVVYKRLSHTYIKMPQRMQMEINVNI